MGPFFLFLPVCHHFTCKGGWCPFLAPGSEQLRDDSSSSCWGQRTGLVDIAKGTLSSEMDVNLHWGSCFLCLFLLDILFLVALTLCLGVSAGRSQAVTAQPSHLESVVTLGESAPWGDLGQQWPGQLQQPGNTSCQSSLKSVSLYGLVGFLVLVPPSNWSPDDTDTLLCPQRHAAIPCFRCSSTFHGCSLAVVEQCLRAEELRARHQAALLQLRRKALRERARAELAWLGHRRRWGHCCWRPARPGVLFPLSQEHNKCKIFLESK